MTTIAEHFGISLEEPPCKVELQKGQVTLYYGKMLPPGLATFAIPIVISWKKYRNIKKTWKSKPITKRLRLKETSNDSN